MTASYLKMLYSCSYKFLQNVARNLGLPANVQRKHLIELLYAKKFKAQERLTEIIHRVTAERRLKTTNRHILLKEKPTQTSKCSSISSHTSTEHLNALVTKQVYTEKQRPTNYNIIETKEKYPNTVGKISNEPKLTMVTESNVHGTSYPPTEEVNTAHEGISHSKLNNKPEANNLDTPESTQPVPVSINKTRRVVIIKMKKKNIISCTVMKKFQTQTSKLSNRVVKTPILYNTPLLQIKKNASELLNSKQNNKSESRVVVEPLPGSHTPVQNNTDSSQSPNHQLNKEIKSIIELNVRKDKPHVSFDKYWVDSCTGYIKKKNDQENHAIYFQLQNSGNNSKQVLLNFKMDMYPYFNIVEPINFEDNGNLTKSETSPLCTKILKVAKNLIKNPNEFKCQFLTDCKLEQTSPTSWIHTCIYCTPEFAKDLQQIPALATNDLHICDPLKSLLSIKPVATNAPVSELFEDALELISEDENYLERIENDMKRLCIFCSWIGSKWFLEDHLRQNHMRYISTFEKEEWVMPYNMHNLLDYSMWMPFVVQYQSALYVMAIKYYVEEDLIVASIYFVPKNGYAITKLAHLKSMGNEQTTTCTWFGPVKEFPYELPCHKDISCFKFKLSELKIIHKIHTADNDKVSLSLFPEGGNKRRSLNDIYIALFIKLYDIETNLDAS